MSTINGSVSQRSDSYSFYIEWSESNIDTSSNASKVLATAYIYCSAHTAYASGLSQKLVIDGTEFTATKSVNLSSGVTVALVSGSKTITHDADGRKSITISADCDLPDGNGYGPAWGSASGTVTLTTIPRYTQIHASVSSVGLNTIGVKWTTDDNISTIQYRLNGGGWIDVETGMNADNGQFTIDGLEPNTSYNVDLDAKRRDSGLWSFSAGKGASFSRTTKDIARISSYNETTSLGDSYAIEYTNPSGATIQVGIYDTEGKNAYSEYRTVTGSSFTFEFTDEKLDLMYKAMKTSNSLSAKLYINTNNNAYREFKDITIKLTGNQKTGHVKVNESWKRSKKWTNVNGTWRRCIRWINVNGTWKRCI